MHRVHRLAAFFSVGAATAATVLISHSPLRAAAAAVPDSVSSACHDSVACVRLTNYGSGTAAIARAAKNSGLIGSSDSSQTGLPSPSHTTAGLVGLDRSRVAGAENTSAGTVGLAADGLGVLGISEINNGTVGLTFNDGSKTGHGAEGILGYDRSLDPSGFNAGVVGLTMFGTGVVGLTGAPSAKQTANYTSFALEGIDASIDGGVGNVGVLASSGGTAVLAISSAAQQPAAKPQRAAILSLCNGAPAFAAHDMHDKHLMTLDCQGNLTIAGHLQTDATSTTLSANGSAVLVHDERGTSATIEETGTAVLRNGVQFVPLSSTFARTIDRRSAYAVLLTPSGDSRGLYVTKEQNGFFVRENSGGRSTVAFDYRIVGTPFTAISATGADNSQSTSAQASDLRSITARQIAHRLRDS